MDFLSKNLEIFSNLVEPSAGFGRTDLSARWTFLQDFRRFSIFLQEPQITRGFLCYIFGFGFSFGFGGDKWLVNIIAIGY